MPFDAKLAVREAVPALIALWGPSGSGKTYTALKMARGLVGPQGKIVLIDTENGRAKFYADLAGGWHHIDFQPPFTPQWYSEAMRAAEEAGADVIVIDSMSHVWEGEGGVLDMADANNVTGLQKFKTPKTLFKRMMNNLLRSRVNVIFCLRAKTLNAQVGRGKDATIVEKGLTPICEKNFIFEMTVSALLGPDHKPVFESTEDLKCNPAVPSVKVPEGASAAIKHNAFMDEATGAAIASWLSGGVAIDHEQRELEREARNTATHGSIALRDWWVSIGGKNQHKLKHMLDELKADAARADLDMANQARDDQPDRRDGDPFADDYTPTPEQEAKAKAMADNLSVG